jgi:hypothetical protein
VQAKWDWDELVHMEMYSLGVIGDGVCRRWNYG